MTPADLQELPVPAVPQPPAADVDAASRRIPPLLLDNLHAGVKPSKGQYVTDGPTLQDMLVDDGHGVGATLWAIDAAIRRGWLTLERWGTHLLLKTTPVLWEAWKLSDFQPSRQRPPAEWCKVLDCSLDTLNRRIKSGKIRAVRITTRWLKIDRRDLPECYDDTVKRY